ncbi:Neurotransmitter-gated ion-channel ligand binding domain protein [Necator americanus]|uniref:Neurotransmitter-gated ion-channel ligand binding domain protein n=1 Tax=Necator americanus TaxID=51031 RepID=W2SQ45_NECAM|nr:Neurotransmitter-gated ion-channel ligand binding domain protein [Necator americanus]ETN71006.1 Neurotransmitter-gated ion-channel ligand binding domain protein [Necator americanus]
MELYQIIQVNEPQQFLMLNAWIVERWVDNLLGWDPEDFSNVTEIMIPFDQIWIPDTTLYNSLVMDDDDTRRLLNAKLTTRGKEKGALVELLYPTIYKLSCLLDLSKFLSFRFFPFDVQTCKLTFGSWTFDNTLIDYYPHNVTHAIGTANCIDNEGWNVLKTSVHRLVNHYACCPNNYTLLEFHLDIQRKPLYYVINLITPTSIITLISIVGFFRYYQKPNRNLLKPFATLISLEEKANSIRGHIFSSSSINELREEKITLGITTLLSMSILIFMVSDKMPSTSSFIPLIGWFYTSMILLISLSTLAASIVIYIQKQGMLGKPPARKIMRWARFVARIVRMEMPLLMKQAYAQKAREEKLRRAQDGRKQSLWQRVYKVAREQAQQRKTSGSSAKINGVAPSPDVQRLQVPKKSCTISTDVTCITEPCDTTGLVEFSNMSDEENSSFPDIDYTAPPPPVSKFQCLQKMSTCASLDSMIRNVDIISPRTMQRNMAELEYDWLAAVVERIFLIFFIIVFLLTAVGINCIGLFYWWTAYDYTV